jgi:hypothetical protein
LEKKEADEDEERRMNKDIQRSRADFGVHYPYNNVQAERLDTGPRSVLQLA